VTVSRTRGRSELSSSPRAIAGGHRRALDQLRDGGSLEETFVRLVGAEVGEVEVYET
jgi:hypothetical protein